MSDSKALSDEIYPDQHHDTYSKTLFGFWLYLLSDFILFSVLFATYVVLNDQTYGGPGARDLFSLPFNLVQTLVFLTCSLTSGLAGALAHRKNVKGTVLFFALTFLFGLCYMGMELSEFTRLVKVGDTWARSAFLSAYFTLVGTHGLHVFFGLLWIIVLMPPVLREGLSPVNIRRLTCLRMFWQFLNIVWIFIFTIVYLLGGRL